MSVSPFMKKILLGVKHGSLSVSGKLVFIYIKSFVDWGVIYINVFVSRYLLSLDHDKGQMYEIESPTLLKLNRITVKCNIDE